MAETLKRIPLLGVSLILVGATMLLQRFHVLSLGWQTLVWGLITLFGIYRTVDGFSERMRGRIFWGSMIFFVGLYNVLTHLDILYFESDLIFPMLVGTVGVSLLFMYLSSPREWHLLIPALFFLGLGFVMVMTELGYFYRWDVIPVVTAYWPVALIIFGASLLIRHRSAER